jgi:hypothetical protein
MEEEYLYLDLASDEGKAMLKVAEEWLRSAYGSMENLDILEIFVCNDEVFAELNIFDRGKYYAASRRIPDEWLRRLKRDWKLKDIGI